MNDYKICVYTICKNEEKFVDRWYDSVKEADYIVVLDTGSTDRTMELLAAKPNVVVKQKIFEVFRFDEARNESMKLIPQDTDICICMDLDEIMQKGWAALLRQKWSDNIDSVLYTIYWSFSKDGRPEVVYKQKKIHKPNEYVWEHAAHEVLTYIGDYPENEIYVPELIKEHHADSTKSRSNYLPLLELDVDEKPEDDRARHYYARELMYQGRYKEAIEQFKIHLSLPSSIWEPERSASMRYISKCSNNINEKEKWLLKAMGETPYLREPFIDMALLQYSISNWCGVVYFCNRALQIKENNKIYTNEPQAWNEVPYDLLSIAYWKIQNYKEAYLSAEKAYEINPNDERIANNVRLLKQYYDKYKEDNVC